MRSLCTPFSHVNASRSRFPSALKPVGKSRHPKLASDATAHRYEPLHKILAPILVHTPRHDVLVKRL